jgi:4-hydroxy-tetrahydrodipicolinate reductase
MTQSLKLGIGGALGRMGIAVASVAGEGGDIEIAARFVREGGIAERDAALAACDVIVDFSSPEASVALAEAAATRGGPALVLGATGFSAGQDAAIAAAAARVAIVKSGNFSIGVNVLAGLVEQAAARLGPDVWDIEIFEAHHRRKVDAPSGTAKLLAEAAARGRRTPLSDLALPPRDGVTGPRQPGGIGFSVMRGGGIVGEHSVVFAADDEIVTLAHSARDRALFARGALLAAAWVRGKGPGLYGMADVLGFGALAGPDRDR